MKTLAMPRPCTGPGTPVHADDAIQPRFDGCPESVLTLAQRIDAFLALGYVAQHRQQMWLTFVVDLDAMDLAFEATTIAAQGRGLGVKGLTCAYLFEEPPIGALALRQDELHRVKFDQLLKTVSMHFAKRRVGIDHLAIRGPYAETGVVVIFPVFDPSATPSLRTPICEDAGWW